MKDSIIERLEVLKEYYTNDDNEGFVYQLLNSDNFKSWVTTYVDGMAIHHTDIVPRDYRKVKEYIEL